MIKKFQIQILNFLFDIDSGVVEENSTGWPFSTTSILDRLLRVSQYTFRHCCPTLHKINQNNTLFVLKNGSQCAFQFKIFETFWSTTIPCTDLAPSNYFLLLHFKQWTMTMFWKRSRNSETTLSTIPTLQLWAICRGFKEAGA